MKKGILLTVFALQLAFVLLASGAQVDSLKIGSSLEGEEDYIELGDILFDAQVVTFWARNIDKKGEVTRTRYSVNCRKGIAAIREITIYGPDEKLLKSYSPGDQKLQWGKIKPGSFMDGFRKVVCEP